MRIIFLSIIFSVCTQALFSQILKGTIKDTEGQPVPYATIYIQELKQGTTSNMKGDYEIHLPAGKYNVVYQSLGYEPETKAVTVGKNPVTIDILLRIQYYQIPEVRITGSGEDPAYGIMRKVIGLAPYWLNHVGSYKANVYLKGNLVIKKIPKLLQRTMKVEARSESGNSASSTTMKEGDTYLMESVNEIEFKAPDKYVQHVISSHSTFPEEGNSVSPMDFIQASFYEPVLIDMAISPLSPDAFSHYKFKYLGITIQGENIIDKIQVIPKRKSQQLFAGTIYIIEDLWCLHSVDLVNDNIAGKIRVQQLYVPVQEDIWMPVSHKFEINIGILGFRADAGYGSSIKYEEVTTNPNLKKPESVSTDWTGNQNRQKISADTIPSKTSQQIEKILAKKDLSNRDMVKLSGLMEKQSKASLPDSVKNNLEIKDKTTYIIEKDAAKKDSAYWAGIRPIPLSETELRSLTLSDSLKAKLAVKGSGTDTTKTDGKKKSGFFSTVKGIARGDTWHDTLGFRFENGGLLKLKNLSFNTVDGFVYGFNFRIYKTWNKANSLVIAPDLKYAFSRESLMWRLNGSYRFKGTSQTSLSFSSGITSKDFNTMGGINIFMNSLTSLFLKRNYMKLYESRFLNLGYRSEITNGLYMNLNVGYEDRRVLTNNTNFSFIKSSRLYTDNIPDNPYLTAPVNPMNELRDQRHADFMATFTFVPHQKYTIREGNKIPRGSDYPAFAIGWKHGINEFRGLTPELRHYDLIRLEVSKTRDVGAFGEFRWRYRAGGFFNNKNVPYYDFFHFSSQPLILAFNDFEDAFRLPQFYSLCTPEIFSEFHTKYTTPYLLLKLLPVLSNTLMRENVSLSFLWSRYHMAYTEIGYSISEFLFLGEIGVYVGFDNLNFKSVGAKVVLKFN
jgi:hypothetical protein